MGFFVVAHVICARSRCGHLMVIKLMHVLKPQCFFMLLLLILRLEKQEKERNILYIDKFNVFGIVAFFSLFVLTA